MGLGCVYISILFWGLWILLTCYCRNFVWLHLIFASLHGFTQPFPSVLTALIELNKIHAMNDVVINALRALVILFGGTPMKIEVNT